jgi:hypothetical protein
MTPKDAKATALSVLDLARAGRFGDIRNRFAVGLQPMVTASALEAAWNAELDQYGPFVAVGTPLAQSIGPAVVVSIPVTFGQGELTLVVSVSATGELTGLQLAAADAARVPPWLPPPYADRGSFDEEEVLLGEGPQAVPGTLSLPTSTGPRPALVLLGGSGPTDRDGTIAKSKPLKDLAWGLASRGITVVRFDKVTYAHPDHVRTDRTFTLYDEYLPHAVAAVDLLRARGDVDPARVFLGGHSLGGTVAPRVATAEKSIAGLVILAGGTEPLQWAAVRQVKYLASLDPSTAGPSQPGIDAMTAQAKQVDSPDLSLGTPDHQLPFGVPAPYWLDLRGYDPVATAAALNKPILICQGGRDYQVTTTDDLSRWETGLAGQPRVDIHVYPADNHFFFPGTGASSPAELAAPQHLDHQVVADIAEWMAAVSGEITGNTG